MHLVLAAAISLGFGLFLAYANPQEGRADKLAARKKKYDDEHKDLLATLAKSNDKPAVQAEIRELALLTASKLLDLIEENPKDDVSLDAAVFAIDICGQTGATGEDANKILAVLTLHHAANPKVKNALVGAMSMGDAGDKLFKAVAEKNPDKEAKGTAMFVRGLKAAQQVEEEEDEKRVDLLVKTATEMLEQAVKEAPDVKIGAGPKAPTIGEVAKKELENLKAVSALAVGKEAPEVETLTLEGKKVKLSDSKGKVVLLDIWATWCPPCRAMIPHERDMVKKLEGKPFELVSVSVDKKKETLTKFLEDNKMPWTHWWDSGEDNPVMKRYRVRAFPTLYLIDHTGVIRNKWVGAPDNKELDKAVDDLVAKAVKAKG
ncbi:MAG: TlpA family protein disulfide reductase [Gemmataceae bacterium]|nr:TlpA family protein disulfide reductase [Gemmataceae bacterium]